MEWDRQTEVWVRDRDSETGRSAEEKERERAKGLLMPPLLLTVTREREAPVLSVTSISLGL